ncbi:MAG: hypothetical protein VX581_09935, partial [Chloroflexota bacterium]|nr:hypothetical protein [Chloroflexota bacterium]
KFSSLNSAVISHLTGEGAILATGAALANAVANALSDFGVHITHLPLSPNNIRSWIRRSSGG